MPNSKMELLVLVYRRFWRSLTNSRF